jgi:eukaryotic-like serine/threonine-protein kinase
VSLTADRLQAGTADRYRIQRELGSGGMATVFLAEDLKHHRLVAVKVLRPELTAGVGPERFLREIEVAAHLQHPHILPLFDSGQLADGSGVLYYVMPYVDGESLRQRISHEKQLPVGEAVRLAGEIADGLAAAHALGVVHRDIKPENILLQGGHAVIADFGLARALTAAAGEQLTQSGMALGTPYYMSPEQATGGDVDGRTDVYALGCVLYEMLTGAPPFTGATVQAVLARHSVDTVAPIRTVRSSVPEAIERVVLRSLAKVPADRYESARQLADALARAAAGGEDAAPAPRWPRLAAAGVVLLGLALGALWWRGQDRGVHLPVADADPPVYPRVAILSFANLSADTGSAYLARGVSEEIASRLGHFPELRVASRSSVERLERAGGDLLAEARSLGFGHLVEGSVRRAGERIRVSVRLVTAADGLRRWDRSYDRASTDLLQLQDEIALDVARAVAGQLVSSSPVPHGGPVPRPEAHDRLLQGNYYLAQRNPRGIARGIEAYTEATRLDSTFALAFAKLAQAYNLLLDWGWSYDGLPPDSLLARGWDAVERAVMLDSALADAWMARGSLLRFSHPGTFDGVRQAIQRAVDLDSSNAEAYHEYGMILRELDQDSAAAARFRRAVSLEPDRPMSLVHLGWIDMNAGRYADARRWLDSAAAVNPGFYQAYAERALVRLVTGDSAGARLDAETAVRLRPASDHLSGEDVLGALDLAAGDTAGVRSRLAGLRRTAPRPEDPGVHQAVAWAAFLVTVGEHREALSFLSNARVAAPHLRMHLEEPRFERLRVDPRFRELMDKLRVRPRD